MRDVSGRLAPGGRGALPPAGHLVRWAPGRDGSPAQSYAPFRRVDPAVLAVALGLLRLGPADRFVDFGCGDGGVLEAAAAMAGLVVGVELDPALALASSARLARAAAAGRVRGRWRVLNEPVGWTAPAGMSAGFVNLLPFAATDVGGWLCRKAPAGFRTVVAGGWSPAPAGARRAAVVDAVEAGGRASPVELWVLGAQGPA